MKDPLHIDINIKRLDDFVTKHSQIQEDLEDGTPVFASVEFSINGACNRRCTFCPRVDEDGYPNIYNSLDIKVFEKNLIDLKKINYKGRFSFSGFSEPLLTKNLHEYISLMKTNLPNSPVEIVSNGDPLTRRNGAKKLNLNDTQFILRNRYLKPDKSYGITISNRAGSVNLTNEVFELKPLEEPLNQPCYYPFYKVLIDYNGDLLMCSNDWKKERVMGNICSESIVTIWKNKIFNNTRKRLAVCDRSHAPCNVCDVEGTMNGKSAFEKWDAFFSSKT